jgi:DNA-directed RNA polymerase specialized sigma24 family protein
MQTAADRFREQRKHRTPSYEQDRELAERITDGDKEALVSLIDRHIGPVYKYLSRRLGPGNESLIAEVVEAAFEEEFRRIHPYARGKASLPLRFKLIRLANKHLAKRRRRIVNDRPPDEREGEELWSLRQEMAKLPMRHQEALSLALFEEIPPEEMAWALRTTRAGAMRRLRGALKRVGKRRHDEGFF